MKVLVVGGGGREHAIIRKLKENPRITELFAAPGNGGIGYDALRVPLAAMVQAYTSTTLSQSANKPYGLQEVRDQVRAAEEAGIGAVLYMNPLGDYSALEEQP